MDPLTTNPEQTLLDLLRQSGDIQGQPIVPQNNPLLGLGAALSGFAAGTQGRPNPVVQQLLAERELNQRSLAHRTQIAGTLASIENQQEQRRLEEARTILAGKKDERDALKAKIDNLRMIGGPMMSSPDAPTRALGGRMTAEALRAMDFKVDDAAMAALTATPFDAKAAEDALKMRAMGIPDAQIIRSKGFAPETWASIVAMAGTDDTRKLIGLPTAAETHMSALDVQTKILTNVQKQIEIATPQFAKELWTYVVANGVDPMKATMADWQRAGREYIAQDLTKALAQQQAQPVSGTLLDSYTAVTGALDNLKTIDKLLKDPKALTDLSSYMGTFEGWGGWKEWLGRKAPNFAGQVPEKTLVLAFAEDQGKNIVIKARSGSAVATHEMSRLENEWPNRARDSFREYSVKHEWAMKAADVLKKRLEILGSAGGRKALESGGLAAYNQYAAEVIMQNPLPPAIESSGKKPNLPKGWEVSP